MEKCLIDTIVLDRIINQKQKDLLFKLLSKYKLVVPVNVLEELFFRIIVVTVGSEIKSDKYFNIKKAWERCYAKEEVKEKIGIIFELMDKGYLEVVDTEYKDIKLAGEIITKHKLLSNDALIVAIALNRGIKKIVTFDEDFKRVDFLEIVEPQS